jgi:membrane-associated phospholipid phosphatase
MGIGRCRAGRKCLLEKDAKASAPRSERHLAISPAVGARPLLASHRFRCRSTAALVVADPHVGPYFRGHAGNLDDLTDVFAGSIASAETAAVPLAPMASGYLRHSRYDVNSALLAGEAYADGAVVDAVLKGVTRRKRPSENALGRPFHDTFFDSHRSFLTGSSFPLGHAVGAFAVATVIAHRYRQRRWVPWAMYGLATAIGLSRVPVRAHFPADVFLGAALGYSIARFQVLQH